MTHQLIIDRTTLEDISHAIQERTTTVIPGDTPGFEYSELQVSKIAETIRKAAYNNHGTYQPVCDPIQLNGKYYAVCDYIHGVLDEEFGQYDTPNEVPLWLCQSDTHNMGHPVDDIYIPVCQLYEGQSKYGSDPFGSVVRLYVYRDNVMCATIGTDDNLIEDTLVSFISTDGDLLQVYTPMAINTTRYFSYVDYTTRYFYTDQAESGMPNFQCVYEGDYFRDFYVDHVFVGSSNIHFVNKSHNASGSLWYWYVYTMDRTGQVCGYTIDLPSGNTQHEVCSDTHIVFKLQETQGWYSCGFLDDDAGGSGVLYELTALSEYVTSGQVTVKCVDNAFIFSDDGIAKFVSVDGISWTATNLV